MAFCSKCKTSVSDTDEFCPKCGNKISFENKKSPNWGYVGVLLLAILAFIFIFGNSYSDKVTCDMVEVPYEEQEEYLKTEYYTETIPYTDQECVSKKLVYSITDFTLTGSICEDKVEECTDYTLGICTAKTTYCTKRQVVCTLMLNNLDDEQGIWTINFKFYKEGSEFIEDTDSFSRGLYPKTSEKVPAIGIISKKELINTPYTCRYQVMQEPSKQVCRDVIKYRDVKKERQVTMYRPVTKYKTEQRCG